MFKVASVLIYNYLLEKGYLFKVKLTIPAHDEWNFEAPEEIAEEVGKVVQDCMSKAGSFFCEKVEVPAEGGIYDYWIH